MAWYLEPKNCDDLLDELVANNKDDSIIATNDTVGFVLEPGDLDRLRKGNLVQVHRLLVEHLKPRQWCNQKPPPITRRDLDYIREQVGGQPFSVSISDRLLVEESR
jgi:hypothetical protein